MPAVALLCLLGVSPSETATTTSETWSLRRALEAQQARLEALEAELAVTQAMLIEDEVGIDPVFPSVRFYGFFETGFQKAWVPESSGLSGLLPTESWSFILGDAHFYLDVMPNPSWRALLELRVNTSSGRDNFELSGYTLISNSEIQLNRPGVGFGGGQIVSSLILERAWIEHTVSDAFAVRAGLWLLPFGIWNVDHGAPTLIASNQPYVNAFQAFPSHQVGVYAFGRILLLPWVLRYQIGVSNGRMSGPVVPQGWANFDFDDDKMLSGRLELSRRESDSLSLGVSAYWGSTTSPDKRIVGVEPLDVEVTTAQQLDEWGVDVDFKYDGDAFKARVEAAYIEHRWPVGRPRSTIFLLRQVPDSRILSLYSLFAFPFHVDAYQFLPYLTLQVLYWPAATAPADLTFIPSLGLNTHLAPGIILKSEAALYERADLIDGQAELVGGDEMFSISVRLVVSF